MRIFILFRAVATLSFAKVKMNSFFVFTKALPLAGRCRTSLSGVYRGFSELAYLRQNADIKEISEICLNRPEVKNSLSMRFLEQLNGVLDSLLKDIKATSCVIITSSSPGMFCSGADLKERLNMNNLEVQAASTFIRKTFQRIHDLPVPTVAAVDGAALGGGAELAIACDIRVGSSRAFFGLPETSHAIIPGGGGTQRLQRIVGVARAKDMIFTGRRVYMEEALHIGLINYGVKSADDAPNVDAAYAKSVEVAEMISQKGPVATRAAKRAINMGEQLDIDKGLRIEETCYLEVAQTKDRVEGLAAFKEKRTPKYKGE